MRYAFLLLLVSCIQIKPPRAPKPIHEEQFGEVAYFPPLTEDQKRYEREKDRIIEWEDVFKDKPVYHRHYPGDPLDPTLPGDK